MPAAVDDASEPSSKRLTRRPATLRRVLIHDQADRDAIASNLLLYRDGRGDDWADIIDFLTMYPGPRCTVVRSVDSRRSR